MVLLLILYKLELPTILPCGAIEMLYTKVVLNFDSLDEILKCDHLNESQ